MVVISHLSSLQCRAGWGPKLNVCRTASGSPHARGDIRSHEPGRVEARATSESVNAERLQVAGASHRHSVSRRNRCLAVLTSQSPWPRLLGIHTLNASCMNSFEIHRTSLITLALLLCACWVGPVNGQSADDQTKPDNTAVNKGGGSRGPVTADQQKMNAADRKMTAKIRRSIMADKVINQMSVKATSQP